MAHPLGIINRPLQGLYAAEAAAHHRRPLRDAQIIGEHGLRFHPVFHRHHRKIGAVIFAALGLMDKGPVLPWQFRQIVEAHHKKTIGVDGLPAPARSSRPARIFIVGRMPPRHMVVTRQGMANQHGIAFIGIERASRFLIIKLKRGSCWPFCSISGVLNGIFCGATSHTPSLWVIVIGKTYGKRLL